MKAVALLLCLLLTACSTTEQAVIKKVEVEVDKTNREIVERVIPKPQPEPEHHTVTISIAGDFMITSHKGEVKKGNFSWTAEQGDYSYFLAEVKDIFEADDFTIGNLETVITDRPLKEVEKDHSPAYWYKAPSSSLQILKEGSVEVMTLANNHTNDYGKDGYYDTIKAVEGYDIILSTSSEIAYMEKDGYIIALVGTGLWNKWQTSSIIPRIEEARENADYVIVYYHGGTERIHQPEDWKVAASRELIDAGADLVIGNHPHVLQPAELYNGKRIIYSMGNFCYGGSSHPENATLIYQFTIDIDTGEITETFIPCYIYTGSTNNWQPAPMLEDSEDYLKVMEFLLNGRESPV